MALQPKSVRGLPRWGFITITYLRGWIVSPAPNPQPGGPGLRIYDPRRQGSPAIPLGISFNPGHHTGIQLITIVNSKDLTTSLILVQD
jgi:hypothetical protein